MKTPTITKFAWLLVLGAALTMSAWSLYYVLRHAGMPPYYAVSTFVVFDGAALLCGDYALKFARVGESGIGARVGMYVFAGASAYINSMHASIAGEPEFYHVVWALPPIIAVAVYEIHTRWERRYALNRTNKKLPALGILTWALHPVRCYRVIRRVTLYQAQRVLALYAPGAFNPEKETSSGSFGEFPGEFPEFGEVSPGFIPFAVSDARVWARSQGYQIADRGPVPMNVIEQYQLHLAAISPPTQENS